MPAGRYVYPVFEDEKSIESDEKKGQAKNRIKKTDRTNTIATNFIYEQLKRSCLLNFNLSIDLGLTSGNATSLGEKLH